MEIALMGTGEYQNFAGGFITTKTFAYDVHADSDFLIAFFAVYNDPGAITVATYNGDNLIVEDAVIYANPIRIGSFYLTNPSTGVNDFIFTWTNAEMPWITIADFQGVHQGSPIYATERHTGNGKILGGSIDTLPLGYTLDMTVKGHTDADTFTATGGQTVHSGAATSLTGIFRGLFSSLDPGGAPSVSPTYSISRVRAWHQLAKSLRNRVPLNQLLMIG